MYIFQKIVALNSFDTFIPAKSCVEHEQEDWQKKNK